MKSIFRGILILFLVHSGLQAAEYYSSSSGLWCLARNGKNYCFRNLPENNHNDVFIVDREIIIRGSLNLYGKLFVEENGVLNISEGGNLNVFGGVEVQFAGYLNISKNLFIGEEGSLNITPYGTVSVENNFTNKSMDIVLDGYLEVLGGFENYGNISGLGKIVSSGACVESAEGNVFGMPNCEGVNYFTLSANVTSFEAKAASSKVYLQWDAELGNNLDSFIVERSVNNTAFSEVGQVKGNVADSGGKYFFTDNFPVEGILLYRLKIQDKQGGYSYHQPLQINLERQLPGSISIFPNPTSGMDFKISLAHTPPKDTEVLIINSQGKQIYSNKVSEDNFSIVPETRLSSGLYWVIINSTEGKIQSRLIVN